MLRLAVVYYDNKIWVEFTEDIFIQLLEEYTSKNGGDIRDAMKQISSELKKKTITT